jgi:phenylpropionate dioxygenase-like ring-hydroxylating dioxygenase large terminal subunit
MVDHRNFPYESIPTGWYQIAWGDDVAQGQVVPLRYFDADLVLYRGESGELHLFDGHCPHMGAHLGYGGCVEGDTITCPFHGWRFDGAGQNCEIPYAKRPNKTRLQAWPVVEVASLILTWYSPSGDAPAWDPLAVPEVEAGTHAGHQLLRTTWTSVRLKPQFIAENIVDAAHQKFVHGAHEIPDVERYEADGATFRVASTFNFGQGKEKTWLTPDGKPRTASLLVEASGLGCLSARFEIDASIHIQTTTPIDGEFADSRATVLTPVAELVDGQPAEGTIHRFKHEAKQYERDLRIWEHLTYVFPNPLPMLELDRFRAFRNWTTQFYPEAEPGHFGRLEEPSS